MQHVSFPSADGRTQLVGYLFLPAAVPAGRRVPAVVMMHGRGRGLWGVGNAYDAAHLAVRHTFWGQEWARSGRIALLVDGFGPRGFPQGFPRGSYEDRPAELSEVTVRPLDAYGALAYLRARPDVRGDAIGLQGWSNGAVQPSPPWTRRPLDQGWSTRHRIQRGPVVLSGLRSQGAVRGSAIQALRADAGAARLGRRGSISEAVPRPRGQQPVPGRRCDVHPLSGRDARLRQSRPLAAAPARERACDGRCRGQGPCPIRPPSASLKRAEQRPLRPVQIFAAATPLHGKRRVRDFIRPASFQSPKH